MLYSASLREVMRNGLGESFWDAHGVEIVACAVVDNFRRFAKILEIFEKMDDQNHFDVKSRFFSIKNVFCLKFDAKSVPEALATSI